MVDYFTWTLIRRRGLADVRLFAKWRAAVFPTRLASNSRTKISWTIGAAWSSMMDVSKHLFGRDEILLASVALEPREQSAARIITWLLFTIVCWRRSIWATLRTHGSVNPSRPPNQRLR